jgi:hypothetical protein
VDTPPAQMEERAGVAPPLRAVRQLLLDVDARDKPGHDGAN